MDTGSVVLTSRVLVLFASYEWQGEQRDGLDIFCIHIGNS